MSGHEPFVPDRGDVVWIDMNRQADHEQAARRPALVVSPASYNGKTGLAMMCPITSRAKGYPFEVALPEGAEVTGVVLSDQVRNLDWRARGATLAMRAPAATTRDVLARLKTLLT